MFLRGKVALVSLTWVANRCVELRAGGELHQEREDGGATPTARLKCYGAGIDLCGGGEGEALLY